MSKFMREVKSNGCISPQRIVQPLYSICPSPVYDPESPNQATLHREHLIEPNTHAAREPRADHDLKVWSHARGNCGYAENALRGKLEALMIEVWGSKLASVVATVVRVVGVWALRGLAVWGNPGVDRGKW
jgi:hypothetical protein